MKYHAPLRIVLITLALFFIFAAISLIAAFSFNALSPADLIVNEIESRLLNPNSLELSFESLSKNIGGSITLNSVSVDLKGTNLIFSSQIRISTSFFGLLKSLLFRSGSFNIDIYDPVLNLGDEEIESLKPLFSGLGGNEEVGGEESGNNYNFSFNFHFYDMTLNFANLSIENSELIATIENNALSSALVRLDEFRINYSGYDIFLRGIEARLNRDELYMLQSGVRSLSVEKDDALFNLSSLALEGSFESFDNLESLNARLSFRNGSFEISDSFYAEIYPAYLSLRENNADLALTLLVASIGNYSISLSNSSLNYNLSSSDFSLDVVNAQLFELSNSFATLQNTVVNGNVNERRVTLRSRNISTNIASRFVQSISSVNLSDTFLSAFGGDSINLSFSTNAEILSHEELIDRASSVINVDFSYSDKVDSLDIAIDNLNIPSLEDNISINAEYESGSVFNVDINYADTAAFNFSFSDQISLIARLEGLSLYEIMPFIDRYAPIFENYIGIDTRMNGIAYANLTVAEDGNYNGDVGFALALANIRFMNFSFNAATSLTSIVSSNVLDISLFNITTDFIRFGFTGDLYLDSFLPSGEIIIENPESGNDYVNVDLNLSSTREYSFNLTLPSFETVNFSGLFNFEDSSHLFSDASLTTERRNYYFFVDLDLRNRRISIENESAVFNLTYIDNIQSYLSFNNFSLPTVGERGEAVTLNGMIDFTFDFQSQIFSSNTSSFSVSNIHMAPGNPDLSFVFALSNEGIRVSDILVESDFLPLMGNLIYNFDTRNLALRVHSEDEELALSIIPYDDYMTGLFSLANFNAERIGLGSNRIDATLSGRGADFDSLAFSGNFDIHSSSLISQAEIYISAREVNITDFVYRNGSISIEVDEANLDSRAANLSFPLFLSYTQSNADRDYPLSLSFDIDVNTEPSDNLFSLFNTLYTERLRNIRGNIRLNDLSVDNGYLRSGEKESAFSYDGSLISFSGDFLDGFISLAESNLDLDLDLGSVAKLSAQGSFIDSDFAIDISIDHFSLGFANMFIILPVINFTADSLAKGDLTLLGMPGNMRLYGSLSAESITFDVFWLPDQTIVAHNAFFSVWNSEIESALMSLTVANNITGERTNVTGTCNFYLTESFGFDHYTVDVFVPDGEYIGFRLPMRNQNIDIVGQVSGHFYMYQRGLQYVNLYGDFNITDTVLSYGLNPLPEWFRSRIRTSYDFNVNLERNNSFVFPLGPNPIISASAAENQFIRVYTNDRSGLGVSGSVNLRAGEIYYFQRSFFIREGSINFRDNNNSSMDPVINLRAQLRAFDSDGRHVDIFLILREADLTNFTPTFESSPAKDLSEIMSILGQQIMNTEADSNLGNVVSLLTTSVDVLQRVGILNQRDDSLQMSIRNSLNLDTFSLHTNIIGNLVYDAVSSAQRSIYWNISPIARYLDGTALYIGKYLSPELYFEALMHLSARRSQEDEDESSAIFSSDLNLDLEVSLEWENPLCTVTLFTRPKRLTIDDSLRYLGITFSKRFVF